MTDKPAVGWRKSSHSHSSGECIEVAAFGAGRFGVRDSKNPGGPMLVLGRAVFGRLLARARTGG